jgi:hypothetical protein
MKRFVELIVIGNAQTVVAIDPQYVVQANEFDSGLGGIGVQLKLVNGDTVNVRGTLKDVLAKLTAE